MMSVIYTKKLFAKNLHWVKPQRRAVCLNLMFCLNNSLYPDAGKIILVGSDHV